MHQYHEMLSSAHSASGGVLKHAGMTNLTATAVFMPEIYHVQTLFESKYEPGHHRMWVYFLYEEKEIEKPKAFFGQYLQIKVLFSKVTSELPKPGIEVWLMNCDA